MRWLMHNWATIVFVLLFLAAFLDPRPKNDVTRRSKRDRMRREYWK